MQEVIVLVLVIVAAMLLIDEGRLLTIDTTPDGSNSGESDHAHDGGNYCNKTQTITWNMRDPPNHFRLKLAVQATLVPSIRLLL